MKRTIHLALVLAAAVLLTSQVAPAGLIDFNSGTLDDAFDLTNNDNWSQQGSGGLNNSGSLLPANEPYAYLVADTQSFTGASISFELSAFFQWDTPSNASGANSLVLALVPTTTGPLDLATNSGDPAEDALRVQLKKESSDPDPTDEVSLVIENQVNGVLADAADRVLSSVVSLTDENWYRLSMSVTRTGSNFNVEASLDNADSTGSVGSNVLSLDLINRPNADLASDADLYAAIGGQRPPARGVAIIDDFSASAVIPEPASMALLGMAVTGLLLTRRKS